MEKYSLAQLREILVDYNLNEKDIIGTGKNGRVLKEDIIRTIDNYLIKEDIYDPRQSTKPKPKAKSKTAGLKAGDWVLYQDDQGLTFKAIVDKVTATTKADIRAVRYLDPEINPNVIFNANRKYLTIIEPENIVVKKVVITIGDSDRSTSYTISSQNLDEFDKINDGIYRMLKENNITFQ